MVSVLVLPVIGFGLLPFADQLWSILVVTALMGTMLGSGAITQPYLAELFSEEVRGTGLGVVRTATAMVGAGGPIVFGLVADYGYFDEGYLILSGIVAVVILLTLRVP